MTPSHAVYPGKFNRFELAELRAYALSLPHRQGTVGYGGTQKVHDMRRSNIRWLDVGEIALYPFRERIKAAMLKANSAFWGLDYRDFGEMQFTEYTASQAGHYDWHRDDNPGGKTPWDRLLSVVVTLADPADYEGGRLYFDGQKEPVDNKAGSIIVFPSSVKHCVTPVTAGVRYSLVCWASGPRITQPESSDEPIRIRTSEDGP